MVDRTIPDLSNKSLHEIQMLDGVNKTWREEGSDTYELGTEGGLRERCQESVLLALISCAFAANMSGSKFQTFQPVSRFRCCARFSARGFNDPLPPPPWLKEDTEDINPVNKHISFRKARIFEKKLSSSNLPILSFRPVSLLFRDCKQYIGRW